MRLLALDPGPVLTAWLVLDGIEGPGPGRVVAYGHESNGTVLELVRTNNHECHGIAIEMIASYGMPVGAEVFETCVWIGRFVEAWGGGLQEWRTKPVMVKRLEVKARLCHSMRATDANVRQAIIDLYGGPTTAIGRKPKNKAERERGVCPGPLNGVSGDVWSAFGVAITAANTPLPPAVDAALARFEGES